MLTAVLSLVPLLPAAPCPPKVTPIARDISVVVHARPPRSGKTTSPTRTTPYFYQYNNRINPSGSCQNSALAMLLGHYGVDITPDEISSRFGTQKAQSPQGLARIFNTYAAESGIPQRLRAHHDGNLEDIDRLLSQNKPVIIHGYFTDAGHVLLTTARTPNGYRVHDPAGAWSQSFKGAYSGRTSANGHGVVYGDRAFEQAISTSNGHTFEPIWYHEIIEAN